MNDRCLIFHKNMAEKLGEKEGMVRRCNEIFASRVFVLKAILLCLGGSQTLTGTVDGAASDFGLMGRSLPVSLCPCV